LKQSRGHHSQALQAVLAIWQNCWRGTASPSFSKKNQYSNIIQGIP